MLHFLTLYIVNKQKFPFLYEHFIFIVTTILFPFLSRNNIFTIDYITSIADIQFVRSHIFCQEQLISLMYSCEYLAQKLQNPKFHDYYQKVRTYTSLKVFRTDRNERLKNTHTFIFNLSNYSKKMYLNFIQFLSLQIYDQIAQLFPANYQFNYYFLLCKFV